MFDPGRTCHASCPVCLPYTRQRAGRIAVGQPVTVEGLHGRFVLARRDRKARQIWIAGGIGVTPFLAWLDELRADPAAAPAVESHYGIRDAGHDPFMRRLQGLCASLPGVRLHVHDRARGDTPSAETLARTASDGQRAEVWFCGPRGFGDQLKAGLCRAWGGQLRFRREAFEMR